MGHRARGCVARQPRDFKSAINTNTGLDNVESDDENSECKDENDNEIISTNSMDIDTNDLDLLHEPSQYWNNFEYTKCDYQCTYEHVFFCGAYDMQSHIGEKPSINDFFEFITEVRSALWKTFVS